MRAGVVSAWLVGWLVVPGASAASPNRVSLDIAEEIGIVSTTHTTVTGAYARRWWENQIYAEARLGLGSNGDLLIVEQRLGIGLVFAPSRRVELLVGWRLGSTHLRGELNQASYSVNLLAVEIPIVVGVRLWPAWHLRLVPAAPTVFWNRTYAGSLGLELGLDHAF